MCINKTYLKLGVAFTAAFGFGFLAGAVYQQRKIKKALEESANELKQFVREGVGVDEPTPETTESEDTIETIDEEDDIVARRKERENPSEVVWNEGAKMARERLRSFADAHPEEAAFIQDFLETHHDAKDFFVEDITPSGCSQEKPIMCMVFDDTDRSFCYTDDSSINGEFAEWEIRLIIIGFFCFSTYRQDEDGTQYPYLLTSDQNIHTPPAIMRHEEQVYTQHARALYFPTIDKEVYIQAVKNENREEIRNTLGQIINYHGGYDCSSDEEELL